MSNTEQTGGRDRVVATVPNITDYRPLVVAPDGRFLMPGRCNVVVDVVGEQRLARVEIDAELIDRRYRIIRLEAFPPPGEGLDLELIRALDVTNYLQAGVAHLVKYERQDGNTYTAEHPIDSPDPLIEVAMIYSVAHAVGLHPTRQVQTSKGLPSHNAAAQWVKRARDAGYLPPTTRGAAS
jgi:hypothetical protein